MVDIRTNATIRTATSSKHCRQKHNGRNPVARMEQDRFALLAVQ